MPFKSEHAARQIDPSKFDDFKRVHEDVAPDGIDFIYGSKSDGLPEIQSVRADAELWDLEKFKAWLVEHDLTDELVEPAASEVASEEMAKGDESSTPAKPEEKIKGSEKNEEGSASGERGGIEVSEETETALRKKVQEHNESAKGDLTKRTDLGAVKAVYRRGAGAFSTSHRPGMTRAQWAYARVNAVLSFARNG